MELKEKKEQLLNRLRKQGIIQSEEVYDAMNNIPRENFIPKNVRNNAYLDTPLRIGNGQTISAPHMNAMMCEALEIKKGDKILEIGTGSGYHAALLAYLTSKEGIVYTIERHETLANKARKNLKRIDISNVKVIVKDGTNGYPDKQPYDKILVTAASPSLPEPLKNQLSSDNGIICIPIGEKYGFQALYKFIKKLDEIVKQRITGVRFVPLIGDHGFQS